MKHIIAILFINFTCLYTFSQKENAEVREGNKQYRDSNFTEAEIYYRKGLEKNGNSFESNFNLGNSLVRQQKYENAIEQYDKAAALTQNDKRRAAASYYNAGNAMLLNNKVAESIDAYKKSLRLNPEDNDTRYNLAFAQMLLKKQQEQQNKDNKDDKQQQKEQEQQQQEQKQEQQQQQQQEQQMSKEQAQQLLQALEQDEKETQEKAKMQQIKGRRSADKNW